jgi:hypothetical protein
VDAGASPALCPHHQLTPSKYSQKSATRAGRIHATLLLLFFSPFAIRKRVHLIH